MIKSGKLSTDPLISQMQCSFRVQSAFKPKTLLSSIIQTHVYSEAARSFSFFITNSMHIVILEEVLCLHTSILSSWFMQNVCYGKFVWKLHFAL